MTDILDQIDALAKKAISTQTDDDEDAYKAALVISYPQIRDRLRAAEAVCEALDKGLDFYPLAAWRRTRDTPK